MQIFKLDARTRLSIEMAPAGDQGRPASIRQQDDAATQLGMCGAISMQRTQGAASMYAAPERFNSPSLSSVAAMATRDHGNPGWHRR